jgi:hypothetical protein
MTLLPEPFSVLDEDFDGHLLPVEDPRTWAGLSVKLRAGRPGPLGKKGKPYIAQPYGSNPEDWSDDYGEESFP